MNEPNVKSQPTPLYVHFLNGTKTRVVPNYNNITQTNSPILETLHTFDAGELSIEPVSVTMSRKTFILLLEGLQPSDIKDYEVCKNCPEYFWFVNRTWHWLPYVGCLSNITPSSRKSRFSLVRHNFHQPRLSTLTSVKKALKVHKVSNWHREL